MSESTGSRTIRTDGLAPQSEATATLIEQLVLDQRQRWQQGAGLRVEAYLARHPDLQTDNAAIVELIRNEIHLRREGGEIGRASCRERV